MTFFFRFAGIGGFVLFLRLPCALTNVCRIAWNIKRERNSNHFDPPSRDKHRNDEKGKRKESGRMEVIARDCDRDFDRALPLGHLSVARWNFKQFPWQNKRAVWSLISIPVRSGRSVINQIISDGV